MSYLIIVILSTESNCASLLFVQACCVAWLQLDLPQEETSWLYLVLIMYTGSICAVHSHTGLSTFGIRACALHILFWLVPPAQFM